jgi:dCTP deaminase
MNNAGPVTLAIHPGIAVCQMIIEELHGRGHYAGRFRDQIIP